MYVRFSLHLCTPAFRLRLVLASCHENRFWGSEKLNQSVTRRRGWLKVALNHLLGKLPRAMGVKSQGTWCLCLWRLGTLGDSTRHMFDVQRSMNTSPSCIILLSSVLSTQAPTSLTILGTSLIRYRLGKGNPHNIRQNYRRKVIWEPLSPTSTLRLSTGIPSYGGWELRRLLNDSGTRVPWMK